MASTVQPLRVCLRACRRTPNPQRSFVAATAAPPIRLQTPATAAAATARRAFSTTQRRPAPEEEEEDETADERNLTAGELRAIEKLKIRWDKMSPAVQQNMDRTMNMVEAEAREAVAAPRMGFKSKKFWNEDEEDSDLITDEQNEDMFDEDDIMSMAHGKFEEFREYREYARLAAWEMPLLSSEWPSFTLLVFAHVFLDVHVKDIKLIVLLLSTIRIGTALRTPECGRAPAVPLHDIHGRVPPCREQGGRRVLPEGPAAGRGAAAEAEEAARPAVQPRDGHCEDEL